MGFVSLFGEGCPALSSLNRQNRRIACVRDVVRTHNFTELAVLIMSCSVTEVRQMSVQYPL